MTTQTANTEGLESLVKYVKENQKPIAYTSAIALAIGVLDQCVLGNRGLDKVGLDVLATYGAYCGLTKKVADPIPAIVAYLTVKFGYEPIFAKNLAGLDSLLGSATALVGTAGLARGLRYAKDNWDEKTKPAIYATGRVTKKAASKTYKGTKIAGNCVLNTRAGKLLIWPIRTLTWPIRKTGNYLFKPSQSTKAPVEVRVTDTQNRPLRDEVSGAEIVVGDSDPNN